MGQTFAAKILTNLSAGLQDKRPINQKNQLKIYTLALNKPKKIKKTSPLTIASKGIKNIRINLIKEV